MTDRVGRRGVRPAGSGLPWSVVLYWVFVGICTLSAQMPPLLITIRWPRCPIPTH